MIRNLKETTLTNKEQDWLKTNLAKFSRMLQGQKDRVAVGNLILGELAPVVSAQHGMLYTMEHNKDDIGTEYSFLKLLASYATDDTDNVQKLNLGQGLVGQCAKGQEQDCALACAGQLRQGFIESGQDIAREYFDSARAL